MNQQIEAFKQHVTEVAQNVLIVAHRDPDPDAIGSCLAMHHVFDQLGIQHSIWLADRLMESQSHFLPGVDCIKQKLDRHQVFDTLLVLDCSNLERVKHIDKVDFPDDNMTVINIDHHADNTRFGDINIFMEISSVGEILCGLFSTLNWPITPEAATCLYAAISFDTGRFLHNNTTHKTFAHVAMLAESGADIYGVNNAMYERKSMETFDLMKLALEHLTVERQKGYAYTVIPHNAPKGEVKIVDFIRQLGDVDIFVVFRELDKKTIRINLRAKSEFNVQKFAAIFGGGGHTRAAGISLKGDLEDTVVSVLAELDKALASHL